MVLVSTSTLLLWEIWAIFGQYYMNVSLFQTKEWKSTRFQLFCVSARVQLTWKVAKILVQNRFYLSFNFVFLIVPESNNISVKQECTYLASLRANAKLKLPRDTAHNACFTVFTRVCYTQLKCVFRLEENVSRVIGCQTRNLVTGEFARTHWLIFIVHKQTAHENT